MATAKDTTEGNQAVKDAMKAKSKNLVKNAKKVDKTPSVDDKEKPPVKKRTGGGRPKKNTGGRPEIAKKDKKSEQICLYITPDEYKKLEKEADKMGGLKVNQYLLMQMKLKKII